MGKEDFHILIIGAGSAGLLVAQALKRFGIGFSLYERQEPWTYQHKQRNWTMALHWGSDFLRNTLPPHLAADIRKAEPDPDIKLEEKEEKSFPFVNGKTGEELVRIPGATTRRVNKEKLRELLSRDLEINYGKKLADIVEEGKKVRAKFLDGTDAVGDLLIGCEGGESVVRTWLLGEEKAKLTVLPIEMYNFTQSYTAEQARFIRHSNHPLIKSSVHPDKRMFYFLVTNGIPNESDPTTWSFQLLLTHWGTDCPKTSAERLARMKELASQCCEPFRSAAAWVKDDTYLAEDHILHWEHPVPWPNHGGRITLAGDAAHCMTPYRGQGLNNAMQDGAVFIQAMESLFENPDVDISSDVFASKLKEVIDGYDAEVFERGKKEIQISAHACRMSHHFEEFMDSPIVKQGLHVKKD